MAKNSASASASASASTSTSSQPQSKKPRNEEAAETKDARVGAVDLNLDLLECPICFEPFRPPIYQCDNGHLLCDSCHENLHKNKCPNCSLPVGSNRNTAIEKIVESAKISCSYMKQGCTEKVSYLNKLEHEKTCNYTPIECPEYICQYVGELKSLYMHFAKKHQTSATKLIFNIAKTLCLEPDGCYIFQELDQQILFLLYRISDPLGSFLKLTCVAPTGADMKFSYELSAEKGEKIISVISPMELTPSVVQPHKDECLLITNEFHELKDGDKSLFLKIVIRKIS